MMPASPPAPPGSFSSSRKLQKPLAERRRRARISLALDRLRLLLLEAESGEAAVAGGPERARHPTCTPPHLHHLLQHPHSRERRGWRGRVEKVVVLELTLSHLRRLAKRTPTHLPDVGGQHFREGYRRCQLEVMRFLGCVASTQPHLATRLWRHLNLPKPSSGYADSSWKYSDHQIFSTVASELCQNDSLGEYVQENMCRPQSAETSLNSCTSELKDSQGVIRKFQNNLPSQTLKVEDKFNQSNQKLHTSYSNNCTPAVPNLRPSMSYFQNYSKPQHLQSFSEKDPHRKHCCVLTVNDRDMASLLQGTPHDTPHLQERSEQLQQTCAKDATERPLPGPSERTEFRPRTAATISVVTPHLRRHPAPLTCTNSDLSPVSCAGPECSNSGISRQCQQQQRQQQQKMSYGKTHWKKSLRISGADGLNNQLWRPW